MNKIGSDDSGVGRERSSEGRVCRSVFRSAGQSDKANKTSDTARMMRPTMERVRRRGDISKVYSNKKIGIDIPPREWYIEHLCPV